MFNLFQKPRPARKPDETGVAIVAMIGNECDIIELFIRHNAPFCDKFYIVLHNSFDATAQIIEKMRAEGFAIDVRVSNEIGYNQHIITTAVVNEAARENRYDYIIPLDADEFLPFDPDLNVLQTIRSRIGANQYGQMWWRGFAPMDADYFTHDNPLTTFRARSFEPQTTPKIILGREFAKKCVTSGGNHFAAKGFLPRLFRRVQPEYVPRLLTKMLPKQISRPPERWLRNHLLPKIIDNFAIDLDIELAHFPSRNAEQLTRKYLLFAYSFAGMKDKILRDRGDSFLARMRRRNYQPDYDFVLNTALKYASTPKSLKNGAPVVDAKVAPALDKRVKMVYGDLAQINLLADMDRFISKRIMGQ